VKERTQKSQGTPGEVFTFFPKRGLISLDGPIADPGCFRDRLL